MGLHLENGLAFTQYIEMPDGGKIIVADWGAQPGWSKETPCHFWNNSIFRLHKGGHVMWQVSRDEGAHPGWATAREKAEAENSDDPWTRSPFMTLILRFADGTRNVDPLTGGGPPTACWIEGSAVLCGTLDGQLYEVDVDTGIALNKMPIGVRLW